MAQVTITLDLSDPEILKLMTEGIKSLSPEHWVTIMSSGIEKAVFTEVKVGRQTESNYNDRRPTLLSLLMETLSKDLLKSSVSDEAVTAIRERILSKANFEDALRAAAANWVIDMVRQSFDVSVRALPLSQQLVSESFKANERMNRAGLPQV